MTIFQNDVGNKKVIGQGSFGTVYCGELDGRDKKTKVAVKIFKSLELFKNEKRILEDLSKSPQIVRCLASSCDPKLLLELADMNLQQKIAKKDYDNKAASHFCLEISKGLDYLLNKGYLHRDLKPSNILIFGENAKLTDFGISVNYSTKSSSWNEKYSSFESLENKHCRESDIYSLGVVILEVFHKKFTSKLGNITQLLLNDKEDFKDIPVDIWDLVLNCVKYNWEDRIQISKVTKILENFTKTLK